MRCKPLLLWLILVPACNLYSYGQVPQKTVPVITERKFGVNGTASCSFYINNSSADSLRIDSKLQDLNIETWNADYIKITFVLKASAASLENLSDNGLLGLLNFSIQNENHCISLLFNEHQPEGSVKQNNRSAMPHGPGRKSLRIESINIRIPHEKNLLLNTNYCTTSLKGKLTSLTGIVGNGQVAGAQCSVRYLSMDIKYTHLYLQDILQGAIISVNSKVKINDAGRMVINSRYSDYSLVKTDSLQSVFVNDQLHIRQSGYLVVYGKYGSIVVGSLTGKMIYKGANTTINLKKASQLVDTIAIDNSYADITIPLDGNNSYVTDITNGTPGVNNKLLNNMRLKGTDTINKPPGLIHTLLSQGKYNKVYGSGPLRTVIIINCNFCNLQL